MGRVGAWKHVVGGMPLEHLCVRLRLWVSHRRDGLEYVQCVRCLFLLSPRVTVWRGTIPSLNLSAAAHLCMIYPLHYVSSSVSVVIALFFLVALYVCIYCIFSDFLLLLGGDIRTYICVYVSHVTYMFAAVVKLLVPSPPLNPTSTYAPPSSCQKSYGKRRNYHFVRTSIV